MLESFFQRQGFLKEGEVHDVQRWKKADFAMLFERIFALINRAGDPKLCFRIEDDVEHTSLEVWWALRCARAFFTDTCTAFPFFRTFDGAPDDLTVDQVAICLVEMEVLYREGNRPEDKRRSYKHFGECAECFDQLMGVVVTTFLSALAGHDFGTVFRLEQQGHQQRKAKALLEKITEIAPTIICRHGQEEILKQFIEQVGPDRTARLLDFLSRRFGNPKATPPTDEEFRRALDEFSKDEPSLPPNTALN